MKKILFAVIVISLSACSFYSRKMSDIPESNYEYVYKTTDIPLFENFEFDKEKSSTFESKKGEIIIAVYGSLSSRVEIENFYETILPSLAWKMLDQQEHKNETKLIFKKKRRILEIGLYREKPLMVKFFIHPKK